MDISLGPKLNQELKQKNDDAVGDDTSVDDDASSTASESVASESSNSQDSSSSMLERLMDWNPCVAGMPNPSSALFKTRVCSECGGKCTKLQGYKKEIVENILVDEKTGEETIVKTKTYFHKWCGTVSDYRQDHKKSYAAVMCNLLDHFRALEFEAQIEREAQLRLIKEQEEKAREEEELAAKAQEAPLETPKRKSFLKRVKKSGKRMKKSFSLSSCMGKNSTSAVSVDAVDAVDGSTSEPQEL